MQKLGLNEIRERYLKFFESKEHLRLPSFSLVPHNDPGLLIINSGMAPLKPYFTGSEEPPRRRVTTCQKCIRTPDIENVGKTARHGTFFEMLGNFSFGDYFKSEAIAWAWEFVTKDMQIPVEKLWMSIYLDDDDAFDIWVKEIGVPADRIVRMGKKDNFWEIGTGPCGPCSEIYFDRGADKGCGQPDCVVGCDCDRYIEFWNLVFTQYNRDDEGNYTNLAKPNIDTGMGLERLACMMQDVDNLFEVDTIKNILNYICKIAGVEYKKSEKNDVSIRVITDHIRSTTMMVCDGILPSNEGRGYVLRRLLRRAARHGKLLGIKNQFLFDVANVVITESKDAYPELGEKAEYIKKVIKMEEEKFDSTIDQGLTILEDFIRVTKQAGGNTVNGADVFKLHDTYGFPLDLTREIAEENGLIVDEEGFRAEMAVQKQKARNAIKNRDSAGWDENIYSKLDKNLKTEFLGYNELTATGKVLYIVKDLEIVDNVLEGDEITVILDRTPFYAESGGQVGDTGYIRSKDGTLKVNGCTKTPDGKYLHSGVVEKGIIEKESNVSMEVDIDRRHQIERNHTTTHLLQKALRNIVGDHVNQAGSLVEADKLRFDFTHYQALDVKELKLIQDEINQKILSNLTVSCEEMSIDDAKKKGATALFGEKYGNVVRVVSIEDYSMELCGGTHLKSTAQAGLVKILGESGVAAGVRRIEAITGFEALEYFNSREQILNNVAMTLKSSTGEVVKKAESLALDLKNAEKEIEKLKSKLINSGLDDVLSKCIEIKGVKVVTANFEQLDMDSLRNTGDTIKNKLGSCVVVLASSVEQKVNLVVTATKDVVAKGIHSGNIIKEVARITGGGGGGRPDMAQAGGKDASKIEEALKASIAIIENQVK